MLIIPKMRIFAVYLSCILVSAGLAQQSLPATYLHVFANKHVYGKLFIRGLYKGIEYYRATFGGLIPCGSRDIVLATGQLAVNSALPVGCELGDYGEHVVGRYVAVQRGSCAFVTKALLAQRAGAAGLLVVNSDVGLLRPPQGNVTEGVEVVIPVVMLHRHMAQVLLDAVPRRRGAVTLLHGILSPSRESCIDPQEWDEEYFTTVANETMHRTAHPLARVAPGGMPKGLSTIREDLIESRMPSTWPGAPTEMATLRFTGVSQPHAHHVQAAAREKADSLAVLPPVEAAMALFGTAALGDSLALSFPVPVDGCSAPTVPPVAGGIAVVQRGTCSMIDKARVMEQAGAAAVLIVNVPDSDGVAQAIGDGEAESRPVNITVGMVSAQDAARWTWEGGDLTGVQVTWEASRASGTAWDELLELRKKGDSAWASDSYHRREQLVTAALVHHPQSATGHASRWTFLQAVLAQHNLTDEMDKVADSISWQDGQGKVEGDGSDAWSLHGGTAAPGVAEDTPLALYLLAGLRGSVLERVQDGPLRCRSHTGSAYHVPIPGPVDPASPYPLTRRVQDLLAIQACLEKLALLNAAALGGYMHLLRSTTEARDWPPLLRSLLGRPYGMGDRDASVAAGLLIDTARALRTVLEADKELEQRTLRDLLAGAAVSNGTATLAVGVAGPGV